MTTEAVSVRAISLELLLSILKEGEYSHLALSAALEKYQYLSKQERGFLTRLTQGVLERQIELDYILNQFSNTKTNKMKPVIRCILQMGVYQLKYMDSVPPSAACNEAVRLTAKKGFSQLKGFVNGVLRNISRNLDKIVYPDENKSPILAASVRYSIPEWMLLQWSRDYGEQKAKSAAAGVLKKERTCVRVNRMKTTPEALIQALKRQGIAAERVVFSEFPKLDYALYLSGYDYLAKIPEFADGQFTVQDLSSMLVTHIAAPKKGDYVIDVCGAPGGKSLHAAELLLGEGFVEARDLTDYKVSLIKENIKRSGLKQICARRIDAKILDKDSVEKADLVLADLPCSGLGTLRKKPEIRYRITKEDEVSLVKLQREILSVVWQYVKPNGFLMYSTCTMDRMENEENTAWFLKQNPQFSLVYERQFFPDEGEMDGFYMACFKRTG